MVFSSPLFLFLFLPAALALYFVVPRFAKNAALLLASLFFYAWGERAFLWVMLTSVAMNYGFGWLVDIVREERKAKLIMTAAVVCNLGMLIAFKYANFLTDSLSGLLALVGGPHLALAPVHLPIGISFFTFHALSYVVDVHRRQARAQRDPIKLALYIALFPQLIAGPILRFHQIADQIDRRRETLALFADGVRRFIIGLAKKVLLANTLAVPADAIFQIAPGGFSRGTAWLGIACYALQIYFDFSGYSDMAIGLGKMFGFRFPENFNYPYVSRSIQEFWHRWHISLSTWFRDYLYIPLGGNRLSPARTYVNLITVFFLCGLWHGASWAFVGWGLFHGLFLVFERLPVLRWIGKVPVVSHVYTLMVILVGWVFFRAETFPQALSFLGTMVRGGPANAVTADFYWNPQVQLAFLAAVVASTPYPSRAVRWCQSRGRTNFLAGPLLETSELAGLAALFLVSVMELASGTYNPFIYFRF